MQDHDVTTDGTLPDVVCLRCGCLCDDIELTVESGQIVSAGRACSLGRDWFCEPLGSDAPACKIDDKTAELSDGLRCAAELLLKARYPLILGLADVSCEAQRAVLAVADLIGGCVDSIASSQASSVHRAIQAVGQVTCSLGEIAQRSDLVIFWGANPARSQPRHAERYSLLPRGMSVPRGRADRYCVLVDTEVTASRDWADELLSVRPGSDFEVLSMLRCLLQGIDVGPAYAMSATGLELAQLANLLDRMKRARYGAILFGEGMAQGLAAHLTVEALLQLVAELNNSTRFVCQSLGCAGNAAGADEVCTWTTGYPAAISFTRGFPRYFGAEYAGVDVLRRREADVVLQLGPLSESLVDEHARQHLASIPRVVLNWSDQTRGADVFFRIAKPGVEATGTAYRCDSVPLPLRAAIRSPYPNADHLLRRLADVIRDSQLADGCER